MATALFKNPNLAFREQTEHSSDGPVLVLLPTHIDLAQGFHNMEEAGTPRKKQLPWGRTHELPHTELQLFV